MAAGGVEVSRPGLQRGLGLVEIMVAMAIGVFMGGVALSILHGNKVTYHVARDIGRLQENARIAMNYLTYDLRMAGYFGCAHSSAAVVNHLNGSSGGALLDQANAIEGYDSSAPMVLRKWLPSGNGDVAGIQSGTDGVTIRYLQPSSSAVTLTADMPSSSAALQISQPNDIEKGDVVAVSDCSSTDIFQVSGPSGSNLATLIHNTGSAVSPGNNNDNAGPGCPGGAVNCLSKNYGSGAQIARYAAYRYYIADGDADGDGSVDAGYPVLYREGLANISTGVTESATQLVDGVEHMSITYGVDTDGDRRPDDYVPAYGSSGAVDLTDPDDWINVVAVKIGLLLRSPDEIAPEEDDRDYVVNGDTVCADDGSVTGCTLTHPVDRRRRKVIETVVLLRNRLSL